MTKSIPITTNSAVERRHTTTAVLGLSILSSLFITACASSPNKIDTPTIEVPKIWANPASSGEPTAWLDSLNSPELEGLIDEALTQSPTLEGTSARFAQTIADARIAGADRLPTAGVGLNRTRQKINNFGPTSTGGVIFENYDFALNLSWEVDLWGKLSDRRSAALARVESSQAELEAAKLSLAAQTTKSWLNLVEAGQQLALAERTAQTYRNHQEAIEARFKRGLIQGFDLRRIRTQAASAEADKNTRLRALDQAARNLEKILGRYPSGTLRSLSRMPILPENVPMGLPADLIGRRPDLIAAERQLAAAEREQRAAKKERLPSISLTASSGRSSQDFDNLLDGDFSVWSLAGNLTQPIFQGGRIKANVDRSTALRNQAAASYRDTALRAFYEVESTLAAETYLRSEQESLSLAAEEAKATELLTWDRYRKGTGDFLIALDAQRNADLAVSRLVSIKSLILQNRVDLYLALGGNFK